MKEFLFIIATLVFLTVCGGVSEWLDIPPLAAMVLVGVPCFWLGLGIYAERNK